MKYLLTTAILLSTGVWAKAPVDISQAINQDLQKEIQKDDYRYQKPIKRGPASVEVEPVAKVPVPAPVEVIDKNVKQIGPDRW